jgi:hypothetical protein
MSDDPLKEPDDPTWRGKTMGAAAAEDQEEAERVDSEEEFDSSIDEVGETPVTPAE